MVTSCTTTYDDLHLQDRKTLPHLPVKYISQDILEKENIIRLKKLSPFRLCSGLFPEGINDEEMSLLTLALSLRAGGDISWHN